MKRHSHRLMPRGEETWWRWAISSRPVYPLRRAVGGNGGLYHRQHQNVRDTQVGDTVTNRDNPCAAPLPGYKKVTSMVYCGLYPADGAKIQRSSGRAGEAAAQRRFPVLRAETSVALEAASAAAFWDCCVSGDHPGERLEREYNLDGLVTTAPSVVYRVHKNNGGDD